MVIDEFNWSSLAPLAPSHAAAGTHDSLAAPANIAKLLAAWNAEVVRYEMLPMLT